MERMIFLIIMSYISYPATLTEGIAQPGNMKKENPILTKVLEITRDVISGPLKGRKVTFMTEKDSLDGDLIAKGLMESVLEPANLVRFPRRLSDLDSEENAETNDLISNSSLANEKSWSRFSTKTSTVIMIISWVDDQWWPFQSTSMNFRELILFSLRTTCLSRNFFETPLVFGTPFFVLICPSTSREANEYDTPFRFWTWKPYARDHQYVDLGLWHPNSFQSWSHIFIDRYDDMTKKNMVILANPEGIPLYFNLTDGSGQGVSYNMVVTFASVLNFNLTINSSRLFYWDYMLERLQAGDSNLFINLIFMTPENYANFDLLTPYLREGHGIVMKIPPPLPKWKNIIYPFSWLVWVVILLSAVCTSFVYHLLHYEYEKSFISNALSVLQFMLSNAMAIVPKKWLLRSFLLVWWIASWVLQMSYTCNLIAVLTIPVFPKWIQTAEELLNSDNGLCMLEYGSFVPNALKISSNPVFAGLGKILYLPSANFSLDYVGEEYCEELVLRNTHAHIEGYSYVKLFYNDRGHSLVTYTLREQIYSSYIVILATKHSPWSYKIDIGIQRLIEAGIIKKWYDDFMQHTKTIYDARSSELQPLSMDHLQGSFYLMLGGIVISVLVLAQEITKANLLQANQ